MVMVKNQKVRKWMPGQIIEALKNVGRNSDSDEVYTPINQVSPILSYLDKSKTYYEATSGISSNILRGFEENGYNIVGSSGRDFFTCSSDDVYDGIVTNPPYSKKDKFIDHCYALGKPFALLLPVASFQGGKRGRMFMERGMSAIVYNNRIDFTGNKSPHFGVAWFVHGFLPPNTIYWVDNPKRDNVTPTPRVSKVVENLDAFLV
jgi:hypothetical protein